VGFERNHPCPCGSGEKFKRCCGRDAESVRALESRLCAMAEIMALPTLTPRLRPMSAGFEAWAREVGRVADHPAEALLDAGVAAMGGEEQRRLLERCALLCGRAWESLREGLGDDEECDVLLLRGAVLAGLHEREPIASAMFRAVERHAEDCEDPVCLLATVLNPTDVWSLVEVAEIEDAAAGDAVRLAELGRWRWTPAHGMRLELVLGRLRSELDRAPPQARAALEAAVHALARRPERRPDLGLALLDQAIDLLAAIERAA
jgi:SEC-C motif